MPIQIKKPASLPHLLVAIAAASILCLPPAFAQSSAPAPHSAARLHEAILAAQAGDGDKALHITAALLAEHPDYAPALKFEGALFEDMGQPRQAEAAFRKAFTLTPSDSELMLKVGIYNLVSGDKTQAITLLNHRLRLAPHDSDALYYLAQAYHLTGQNDLALKTIKAAIKEDPHTPSLWQKYGELLCSSGDNTAALTWLAKAQAADPKLEQIDFDMAVASFNNQDLDNALKSATGAVARHPTDAPALALLGSIDVKLSHWQDAATFFERVLESEGNDSSALLGLGHAELELKNYQLAADSLERVLRQDPTQVLAHFYLSRAYAALGLNDDAEREALLHRRMLEQQASVATGKESTQQQATIGRARKLLADNHEAEALQLFRDGKDGFIATPGSADALVGALYLSMNRPDDAVRCLNKALSIDPTARGAHTYLGVLALQQSEFDHAENEFNQELSAHPNDPIATAELGELRYRQGRWQEAADRISQSKSAVPYLLYMLCDSYFHLGKTKDADVTAELVVDYSKGDPEMLARIIDLLKRNQQDTFAQHLSSKAASASSASSPAVKE